MNTYISSFIRIIGMLRDFLDQYPTWTRYLAGIAVLLCAVVLVSLLFAPHRKPLQIISPSNNDVIIKAGITISATSPHKNKNHFVVVIPLETGDHWIQPGPMEKTNAGFSGQAKLGDGDHGQKEKFALYVVATKTILHNGNLGPNMFPSDSEFSEKIIVERQ